MIERNLKTKFNSLQFTPYVREQVVVRSMIRSMTNYDSESFVLAVEGAIKDIEWANRRKDVALKYDKETVDGEWRKYAELRKAWLQSVDVILAMKQDAMKSNSNASKEKRK